MKKRLFNFKSLVFLLGLSWLSIGAFAQTQVGNSDFEAWGGLGGANERPTNFNNMKNGDLCFLCGFGSIQTTWRDVARPGSTGTYSAKIVTGKASGVIVNGNLTVGKLTAPSTTPSAGYNLTVTSDANFSEAITDRPDSIVVWAKYSVTTSADSARISAILHDNYSLRDPQDGSSAPHVVAKAVKNFQTGNNWIRLSVPFNYSGPASTVNYILLTFASSYAPAAGVNGAALYIDDLELIYNNPVKVTPIAVQNLIENQTGTTLTATEGGTAMYLGAADSREWKYTTTSGSGYTSFTIAQTGTTYTPQFATAGTYYVVCQSNFGGAIKTSNEVKVVVTALANSIAPTAVQNLVENQSGNLLTVTETPASSSREWKYTTTSGTGYTSFGTAQTGTTYTPNFATAGTYFVVCQSTLYGVTKTSNEVKVVVTPYTNSIAPTATQNLVTNQTGTLLTVAESPTASSREWKYTTTSGSGYTSFGTAETGTTYTPMFASVGTYYVVCQSTYGGNTATSNEVQVNVTAFTNSIAPTATQNLVENQVGNTLTVTENATATSREWKFSTTSGSGYTSFGTAETGTTYTPQFATANTYYVVCESTFGGNTVTSNEVQINVTVAVSNAVSISPNSVQNLIETQVGTTITASETPVAADSREWKFSTTSGSGYASFTVAETGTTYAPVFATAGTYYVVCISDFAGDIQTSNEVQINVSAFSNSIAPTATQNLLETEVGTLLTVTETPTATSREWKFSTTSGSGYGSFGTAETGTTYSPVFAAAGTYYVVCESTIAGITVISNEVEIIVTTFTNSIAPAATQNLSENEVGTLLTVTETPTADSREWKFSTTSGSGYSSFGSAETGTTYTPQFASVGTYYVVCESTLNGITKTSNEVEIIVSAFTNSIAPATTQNLYENQAGTLLTVTESATADSREWLFSTTSGSGYGSFGTAETGTTYTPIFATAGTYYVVCNSTLGGNTVTSNEVQINVTVAPSQTVTIAPTTTQNLLEAQAGTQLTVTETPVADSREWKFSTTSGSGYGSFGTAQTGMTYTPQFATAGTYYVICEADYSGTMVNSNEVTVIVTVDHTGINENTNYSFAVYSAENSLKVDLSNTEMKDATIEVLSIDGKVIAKQALTSNQMNTINVNVPTGVYFFAISNGSQFFQGKVFIK